MAFFDWNQNGKNDMFDSFVDYQVYKDTFGEEDEYDYEDDYEDDDEYDYEDDDEYDEYDEELKDSSSYYYESPTTSSVLTPQEEYCGFAEIADKSTEEILRILLKRKQKMDTYYEDCSVKSGFREVMDNRQMWKDFWLFNFAKILDYCTLQQTEKCQLLQLLLDMFAVDNPMSARKHYKNMSTNHAYYIYMTHCFGYKTTDCAIFWLILANMSGNEGEQMDMTIGLVEEHLRFMVQLEEYLKRMFPGRGFGGHMQKYIVELLKYILDAVDNSDNAIANTSFIVNPVLSHS